MVIIHKTPASLCAPPNLADYAATRAGFSWEAMRGRLGGLPGGACNIAHEAVDRHAAGPISTRAAFRLLVAEEGGHTDIPGTLDLRRLLEQAEGPDAIEPTGPEDGSLLHGVTSIIDEADFDAERWYQILQDQRVTVWYTAPTAIRMLMKAGPDIPKKYAFPQLRFIASVGEPLNPEAVIWGEKVLGLPIHDNGWQTETGGIMIANFPACDIKPGSMGRPLPGVEAAIVRHGEDGALSVVESPDSEGELALKPGWPSMFRGYLDNPGRYQQCFAGGWYLAGDLAKRDADGYYWFVGRADDVIKSAGHLIGPFEVESVLMEHPAVAEAGVIGKPDAVVGETVKAFVSLKQGFEPDEALRMQILAHARKRLGAAVAPKEIAFLAALPRTRSGKILRRLLKARELGLPEGDTSTLEAGA